jgi:dTDP-4-amino-4,6-dideoxygalactose transaminase
MQFRDLNAQYNALKLKIDEAMISVASAGDYISGQKVTEFEGYLAEYIGVKHCISCGNGTDALTLVLMGWDIKKGDAVFVPDFTFVSTAEVVALAGATPIFVDVYPDTFNIDAEKLEEQISKVIAQGELIPKAIIPVDLFGLPSDYHEIEKVAQKYNLLILEDGAQGFGGNINGKRACSFGNASTTSFFPAKPLGCYGDGGAVFTDDDDLASIIKSIKVHGKGADKYDNVRIGLNSRLDTIQAAILIPKFNAFREYELENVNKAAQKYTSHLSTLKGVKTPKIPEGYYSSWAQYTLVFENRKKRNNMQIALKNKGVPSMIYYRTPMHSQTVFSNLSYLKDVDAEKKTDYSVTEMLCDCVLSLPMHPYLDDEDIEIVTDGICDLFSM